MEDNESLLRYIMLSLIPGIGPVGANSILDEFSGIAPCFEMDKEELAERIEKCERSGAVRRLFDFRNSEELKRKACAILSDCAARGINVITREKEDYPVRFRNISDMPIVFYTKGLLRINEFEKSIGIVGARRCTAEGKWRSVELAEKTIKSGGAVVSGMAKGIDSYAHTAAIKTGGYTLAVTGTGPDICYPKEHQALYEAIAESGCILSEYPPGTKAVPYRFPQRNRIIAALSDELYVIDAGRNSGTESTVEAAVRYGRNVFKEGQTVRQESFTSLIEHYDRCHIGDP